MNTIRLCKCFVFEREFNFYFKNWIDQKSIEEDNNNRIEW
jgi:hypothetical protein